MTTALRLKSKWVPGVFSSKTKLILILVALAGQVRAQEQIWLWPEDYQQMFRYAGLFDDAQYSFGARRPNSEDCSSLMQKLFSLVGIELPRSSREQAMDERFVEVPLEELRAGDLVFFRNTWRRGISHVAFMVDHQTMIHSSPRSKKVITSTLSQRHPLWRKIHSVRRWKHSVDPTYVQPRFSWDDKV